MILSCAQNSLLAILLVGLMGPWVAFGQERVRRNVEIEWETVPGAIRYEIQIIRKGDSSAKLLNFTTQKSIWQATIKPGTYSMQMRSYDSRGVPGDWTPATDLIVKLPAIIPIEPANKATVKAAEERYPLNLRWEPVPGAAKYQLEIRSTTSDWTSKQDVSGNTVAITVNAGEDYAWNVIPIDQIGEPGEQSTEPYQVSVQGPPLAKPNVEKPITKFVRELSWAMPKHSTTVSYDLSYFNKASKKWVSIDSKGDFKERSLPLDISRPSGVYRLSLTAHAPRRLSSPESQMVFAFRGGFRSPAALETAELRDSIYKPTSFYAIASYLLTRIYYQGSVYEDNSGLSFRALGGTGRLGLGYQPYNSDWGGFAIVDLSGFNISRNNYTFAAAEALASRRFVFERGAVILASAGPFYKELPIIRGSETVGFRGTGKVHNLGAQGGFTYWLPLNNRFGVQMNARAYQTLSGTSDSGQKVLSGFSYQYGLLGSYRLKSDWMGYLGYAHRTDETRYNADPNAPASFANPGDVDQIRIKGDYLNLILELSF